MTTINRTLPSKFTSLADTPSSYVGHAGETFVVNPAEDGITYSTTSDHYSFDYSNVVLTIPQYQQMLVLQCVELKENIIIEGKLCVID